MTGTTLDRSTRADGQLDDQQPLQQLADAVATLWSAGTGLTLQPAAGALDATHARVVPGERPRRPPAWAGGRCAVAGTSLERRSRTTCPARPPDPGEEPCTRSLPIMPGRTADSTETVHSCRLSVPTARTCA